MLKTAAALALLFGYAYAWTPYNHASCKLSDITIRSIRVSPFAEGSDTFNNLILETHNACAESIGVELHLVLRDRNDTVVRTEDLWPAGTNNIPAGTTYAFSEPVYKPAVKAEVTVVQIDKWKVD